MKKTHKNIIIFSDYHLSKIIKSFSFFLVMNSACLFSFYSKALAQEGQLPPCILSSLVPRDQCIDTIKDGETIYSGEFIQDKKNGHGVITYKDGSKYTGEFFNDEKEGHGTLISSNGDKYVGNWKHNLQNGYGVLNSSDGSTYSGSFLNGNKEGKGTLKKIDGTMLSGNFKNNELISGTINFSNGEVYSGELINNKRSGYGKSILPLGETYIGSYELDERNGLGTLIYQTKHKYVGEFKNGKREGKGSLYDADGNVLYSGLWAEDAQVGTLRGNNFIPLIKDNEIYSVEVVINQNIKELAKIDLRIKEISIPVSIVTTMIRMGMLNQGSFIGTDPFTMRDGVILPSKSFQIQEIKIGSYSITNQPATIDIKGKDIKIGRGTLETFSAWSIDKDKNILILR